MTETLPQLLRQRAANDSGNRGATPSPAANMDALASATVEEAFSARLRARLRPFQGMATRAQTQVSQAQLDAPGPVALVPAPAPDAPSLQLAQTPVVNEVAAEAPATEGCPARCSSERKPAQPSTLQTAPPAEVAQEAPPTEVAQGDSSQWMQLLEGLSSPDGVEGSSSSQALPLPEETETDMELVEMVAERARDSPSRCPPRTVRAAWGEDLSALDDECIATALTSSPSSAFQEEVERTPRGGVKETSAGRADQLSPAHSRTTVDKNVETGNLDSTACGGCASSSDDCSRVAVLDAHPLDPGEMDKDVTQREG